MAGARIAEAYVQIVPTTSGIGSALTKEFGGAGATGGTAMGGGLMAAAKRFAGPLAAVFGTAAIVGFSRKLIEVGEAQATADARTAQIAESMGLFGAETDNVVSRLGDLAAATAQATGVDQNSIKATQAKLLTFKELADTADTAGGAFDRATNAALDLAAAGFGTAETNAVQLGKALNDPIKGMAALSRSGVTFTAEEQERIKTLVESNKLGEAQALILGAIETQVGGTAVATANSSDRMREGFLVVQQALAEKVLPIFDKLAGVIVDYVFPAMLTVIDLIPDMTDGFGGSLGPIIEKMGDIFKTLWDAVQPLIPTIMELITNFSPLAVIFGLIQPILPLIVDLLGRIGEVFLQLAPLVLDLAGVMLGAFMDAIQSLLPVLPTVLDLISQLLPVFILLIPPILDLVKAILPLVVMLIQFLAPILIFVVKIIAGLLIPIIKLLVGAFTVIATVATFVVQVVTAIFTGLGSFFKGFWDGVKAVFGAVGTFFTTTFVGFVRLAVSGITTAFGALGSFFSGLWEGIKSGFKGFINFIIDRINGFIRGLNVIAGAISKVTGGAVNFSIRELPKLAQGGNITGAGSVIVGEEGPEILNLPRGAQVVPLSRDDGRGETLQVNFELTPAGGRPLDEQVLEAVSRLRIRSAARARA
jgi:phage-related protein